MLVPMPGRNDVLLFDLGGVLVDVAPAGEMYASLGLEATETSTAPWVLRDFWLRFETNEIDAETFCERFVAEFSLTVDAAHVHTQFEAWNRGMLPFAVETLDELRGRHRLAVLSNTNEIHWRRLAGEMAIPEMVEAAFASHLIGMRKPDERIYRHVASELGVDVTDLVFFDDNAENIRAALEIGLRAWQVEGVAALRARLKAEGYL